MRLKRGSIELPPIYAPVDAAAAASLLLLVCPLANALQFVVESSITCKPIEHKENWSQQEKGSVNAEKTRTQIIYRILHIRDDRALSNSLKRKAHYP